jgi:catechol 2,3-dioxygenase-like lactoylglutathione lyase family enzyme
MVGVRIHHIAMRTHEVDRLVAFYEGLLGLRVTRRDDARGSAWLDAQGTILMIERAGDGEPGICAGTLELVAFAVDDREAWRDRLTRARVAIEAETAHTLYFRDPDGRRVAVSNWPGRAD